MLRSDVEKEVRETAALALPVVFTQLGLNFLSTVDSLIVAPLGKYALGGVGIGNAMFFTVSLFALGTIMALDPLIAQSFGGGRRSRCGALLWQGIFVALALSVPFTALFLDFGWALRLAGQPPEVVPIASDYLRGRAWNVPTMLLFAALRGFLNGVGNTRAVMWVVLATNAVNAAVVYALVHGFGPIPAFGVVGAGYGTSIAGIFMAGGLAWAIRSGGYGEFGLAPVARPDPATMGQIVRFGLPIGGTITAEVGVFAAAFAVMGHIGPDALAAHQAAIQLASLSFMVPLGIGVAGSIRVGQAVGRGAPQDALRAGLVAYGLGVGFMALSAALFWAAPAFFGGFFTKEPAVLALAATLIRIAALFQLSDGAQAVGAGCLRGAGDSRTALIVNIAAHWGLGFPLGYALAMWAGLGAAGMWLGLTASLTVVAVLLAWRFVALGRRLAARPAAAAATGSSPPA